MIDVKLLVGDFENLAAQLEKRGVDRDVLLNVVKLDEERRDILKDVEPLRAKRNRVSKEIGKMKDSAAREAKIQEMQALKDAIDASTNELREVEAALRNALMWIPNIPHSSVPPGETWEDNEVIRVEKYDPDKYSAQEYRPHWELAEEHGLMDIERASKLSGSNWPLYQGLGAKLIRALLQLGFDLHGEKYAEVSPPYFVRTEVMEGTGHLPKFEQDMYRMRDDDLWAIPTAEVPLTSYFRDEILSEDDLPRYFMAYSACFRREAGAAGRENRGLLRVHQFHKLELLKFTTPDQSYAELESLLADAEAIIKLLDIPYRIVNCCMGDLGGSAAKIYDIEAYIPSLERWFEVSSIGNFTDYQARRANIRFRNAKGSTEHVHTLNGSGISTPRVWAAVVEHGQQSDGSIVIPQALRDYMGLEVIAS